MRDIKHIVEHKDAYTQSIKNRCVSVDIDEIIRLYHAKNTLLQEVEALNHQRNTLAKASSQCTDKERADLVAQGKAIKEKISRTDIARKEIEEVLARDVLKIPNLVHPDTPIGKEEKDNLVIKHYKKPTVFDFTPKDHIALGQDLDIIDFEKAKSIAGQKFYFLKNQAVLLELALLRFGLDILSDHGYTPYSTPDLAKLDVIHSLGFNPRGPESNIYSVENEDVGLIGTAEIPLGAYYSHNTLSRDMLPVRMAGISHCYRKEAGAAGQYSKGLYRVHQFTKLEMFVFCTPEDSERMHQELLAIEEKIYQSLEIPYRVVDICTGDLGNPAYRKYDIEAWMPGRKGGEYGEITSASNCTDYQSKRLNIKMKHQDHKPLFLHTLNGTAIAISRTLISILENFQNKDGSVSVPSVLIPYCGFEKILPALSHT